MPKIMLVDPKLSPTDAFLWEHFRDFIQQLGGVLDADVRRGCMALVNGNPGLKASFADTITQAPREVPYAATEEQKAKAFTAPMVLPQDQAFATGQIGTVDEHREKYNTGMGNVTPDSGLSVPIDRRGWLPDTPANTVAVSRAGSGRRAHEC